MKTLHRFFLASILSALLVAMVGVVPHAAAAEKTNLRFATIQFSGDTNQYIGQLISDFEATNPDITVTVETRSVDAHKEALRTLLTTPSSPDLYFMWGGTGLGGFYVDAGAAAPLDDYYAKYHWADRFLPTALAATKFNNKTYGVPYTIHGMGLYYRKDTLQKAGITAIPTTYDELVAANAKLKDSGITALSVGGKFGWNTMRLTDSLLETECGAKLHDDLKALKADWSKETCVTKAYQELSRWVVQGWLPKNFLGLDPAEAAAPLYKGDAAMQYEGDWRVQAIKADGENLDDYAFFAFPTGTNRLSFFTEMLFIAQNSKNKDAAAKLIDYWTSPAVQQKYLGKFGSVSPTKGVTATKDQLPLDAAWEKTLATFKDVYPPADQGLPAELVSSYFKVQDDVIGGALKPEDAGKTFQDAITKYLAEKK